MHRKFTNFCNYQPNMNGLLMGETAPQHLRTNIRWHIVTTKDTCIRKQHLQIWGQKCPTSHSPHPLPYNSQLWHTITTEYYFFETNEAKFSETYQDVTHIIGMSDVITENEVSIDTLVARVTVLGYGTWLVAECSRVTFDVSQFIRQWCKLIRTPSNCEKESTTQLLFWFVIQFMGERGQRSGWQGWPMHKK